ncbi:hypothetical protein [Paenibacillus eucommiae]|uniref:Uncharacterized protein n=1 Tax=Paenibacillus eucommiae TaxID=1355755 RepID=A0ABS4J3B9_9BACL|nr:hypothetical protein [Paenibacillus eucommiae]MBP1994303.1 hypothetical protein [Paenibacillus eucommiae]
MIFIVKARLWRGSATLTMKNIVKASTPLSCAFSSSPAPAPARKSLLTKRKTLAGSPFELGVRVIRAIVAKER